MGGFVPAESINKIGHMNIKELLLEGVRVSFPYKREREEWVGEAKILILGPYYKKSRIMFDNGYELKEWQLEEIDAAVEYYKSVIFNPTNLMYKMLESTIEYSKISNDLAVDLDDEGVLEKVRAIRLKLIEKSNVK